MSKFAIRRRVLAGLCAAVLAPAAIVTATAIPAQADLQASYEEICNGGYVPIHAKDLWLRNSNNAIVGVVIIGRNTGTGTSGGRVCVATIKYDSVERWTEAGVYDMTDGEVRYDDGNYTRYAGEPCITPRDADCSAIHARGHYVHYWGIVDGVFRDDYYQWT